MYDKREIEIETIQQAKSRWITEEQRRFQESMEDKNRYERKKIWNRLEDDKGDVDQYGRTYEERLALYPKELGVLKIKEESRMLRDSADVLIGSNYFEK